MGTGFSGGLGGKSGCANKVLLHMTAHIANKHLFRGNSFVFTTGIKINTGLLQI